MLVKLPPGPSVLVATFLGSLYLLWSATPYSEYQMIIADRNKLYEVNNSEKKEMSLKGMCMHHRTQKAYPHWSYAMDSACRTCEKWDGLWHLTEVADAA